MIRFIVAASLYLLVLLRASDAQAQPPRVVLLEFPTMKGAWPQANRRTYAELLSLGIEVVVAHEPASWLDIYPLTRDRGAVSALRIARLATPFLPPDSAPAEPELERNAQLATLIELTVYDAQTGTYRVERVDRRDGEPLTVDATAILAAEFLNASLVKIASQAANAAASKPAPAPPLYTRVSPLDEPSPPLDEPSPPLAPSELKRLGLRFEVAPRFAAQAGAAWAVRPAAIGRLLPALTLGIEVELPVIPWTFQSETLSSSLEASAVNLELATSVSVGDVLEWEARLGFGAVQMLSSGDAAPGTEARTERLRLPRGALGTGLALRLSDDVRIHFGLQMGVLASKVVVRFQGERQADFGPLTFGATAGMSIFAF